MHLRKGSRHAQGFTLLELLIAITIIAILAVLIVPKLMGVRRQAQETALKTNLQSLRKAITRFNADTGICPATLNQLVAPATNPPTTGAGGALIFAGTYGGPYFASQGGLDGNGLPTNPFKPPQESDYTDATKHWTYDPATGSVSAAVPSGTCLDGVPYSRL